MFRSEIVTQSDFVGHTGEPTTLTPLLAAPREIGELSSISIDLGKEGPSEARRASARRACAGRLWFASIGGVAGYLFAAIGTAPPLSVAIAVMAALACYGATGWLVRGPRTTFVGEQGVARYWHRSRKTEHLRFADVKALRVGYAGNHSNIAFAYTFERAGAPSFRIVGSYALNAADEPDAFSDHPLWFARAAETAYVGFRLPRALAALARGDSVRFEVTKREAVTLTPDGIQLEPARGGVYRSAWRFAALPRVNGEMIEFMAPKHEPKQRASANPFAAPEADVEQTVVIFRGSELPDGALLVALMEAKIREARGVVTGMPTNETRARR
jgi:hypothetical protein